MRSIERGDRLPPRSDAEMERGTVRDHGGSSRKIEVSGPAGPLLRRDPIRWPRYGPNFHQDQSLTPRRGT